jgi:hypothetical protein
MEPEIPGESYCLFSAPGRDGHDGRKLVVHHSGIRDPFSGGTYTFRVYTTDSPDGSGSGFIQVVLKPLNPAFEVITLSMKSQDEVKAIAEFVEVVRGRRRL